jgi:hypothetical protein
VSFARWTINLCDDQFVRLHEVGAGSFSGVQRVNEAGQWRVDMIAGELAEELIPDVKTVLVVDGSTVRYAGYVARLGAAGGGALLAQSGDQRRIVFEGRDVWELLARRVVFPDPTTGAFDTDAYDVRSGVASTVAAEFIEANVGIAALPDRQVAGVSVFDPQVGVSGTWSGRLQPLDRFVGEICETGNIVCVAGVDAAFEPRFTLRAPVDRSNTVVFSDIGDLSESSKGWIPALASTVIAAGQGEGTSRDFAVAGGTVAGLERVELVTEQTNATTTAQLGLIAEAIRRDEGAQFVIEGAISDQAARQYPAGVAYQLGDRVGFNIGPSRVPVRVTSVTTTVNAERSVQLPVFGRWTPDRLQGLRRDVLGLADRFDSQVR